MRQKPLEISKTKLKTWVTLEQLAKQINYGKNAVLRAVERLEGMEYRLRPSNKPGRKALQFRVKP